MIIITDGAAAQVIPTTPIADLAREKEAYEKSLRDGSYDKRKWNHLEFHQQQDEVAAMFGDLNGWYLSNEAFVPFDIADDSFKLDDMTKLNAYNLRHISYRWMDHAICFKAHRPEWEIARCIAIVGQPYGNIDRHRRELDEVAKRYGLRWHVAPNPTASIYLPGQALFIVLTLPDGEVVWLPEQMLPSKDSVPKIGVHTPGKGHERKPAAEASPQCDAWPAPVDLWANFSPPELPTGLLPEVIEKFARIEGAAMGADPAGLAMAALTVCAAAISDEIKIQPKRYADFWKESARLWAFLVGNPSTKKSPIMNQAAWPVKRIDGILFQQYQADLATYNALPADERKTAEPPKQKRRRIEDVTIEAAQEVLKDSPDGVLCLQDELSGFFGMMDRYAGDRGGMKDRSFWLQAWNGGEYICDRIKRGSVLIPNLSVSLLGGIQPDAIRKIAADTVDDGLLQRGCPIVLRPATIGRDEPADPVNAEYRKLIEALHEMKPPRAGSDGNYFLRSNALRFDNVAQEIRNELERKHIDLQCYEAVNKKLSAHIGKYDGIFLRLCVIFHCIENVGRELPIDVTADTTERVAKFLHEFLLPHAIAFYAGVLGLSDDHDRLTNLAGYILAHKLDEITNRDVHRGDRSMRKLTKRGTETLFQQLEALGWVTHGEGRHGRSSLCLVNPEVHRLFRDRAEKEAERRSSIRKMIVEQVRKAGQS